MGRRGYPPEFRKRVLDLLDAGRKVVDLARDLGISNQTIYAWRRQKPSTEPYWNVMKGWTAGVSGTVTATATYDPFGNLVASTGSVPSWRWQGSWQDSVTGLYYVVARWYAPTLGCHDLGRLVVALGNGIGPLLPAH